MNQWNERTMRMKTTFFQGEKVTPRIQCYIMSRHVSYLNSLAQGLHRRTTSPRRGKSPRREGKENTARIEHTRYIHTRECFEIP